MQNSPTQSNFLLPVCSQLRLNLFRIIRKKKLIKNSLSVLRAYFLSCMLNESINNVVLYGHKPIVWDSLTSLTTQVVKIWPMNFSLLCATEKNSIFLYVLFFINQLCTPLLRPIYTVRFCRIQPLYDTLTTPLGHDCRKVLKHVLKS